MTKKEKMKRRTFNALSLSLLLPKASFGGVELPDRKAEHRDINYLYYHRNLNGNMRPYNLAISTTKKQASEVEFLKVKGLFIYYDHSMKLTLSIFSDIAYVFIPVKRFLNGNVAHLHNVKINGRNTLIIRKTFLASDVIGTLEIKPEKMEFMTSNEAEESKSNVRTTKQRTN